MVDCPACRAGSAYGLEQTESVVDHDDLRGGKPFQKGCIQRLYGVEVEDVHGKITTRCDDVAEDRPRCCDG